MKRFFTRVVTLASYASTLFTTVVAPSADIANVDDSLIERAFREAFGVGTAYAQQMPLSAFFQYVDLELADIPAPGFQSELVSAIFDALRRYCSGGGTDLPTAIEVAEAYPAFPGIAPAYTEALQMAVMAGVCPMTTAELALLGDLS